MEDIFNIDDKIEHIRRYKGTKYREGLLVFYDNLDKVWKITDGVNERRTKNYQCVDGFFNGFATVRENNKLGFINTLGEEVVPCKYQFCKKFEEGLAAVKNEKDLWGFVNQQGEEVIRCQYPEVYDFSEGLASVMDYSGFWGFIDQTGKEVIPCYYSFAGNFHDGIAIVGRDERYGVIDKHGETIVQREYESIQVISEDLMAVKDPDTNRWGYIDRTGEIKIPCDYFRCNSFHDGMAVVRDYVNGYGYINKAGKRIRGNYAEAHDFHEGMAKVFDHDLGMTFINKDGSSNGIAWYKSVENFKGDFAVVITDSWKYGVIDKTGKLVVPCDYDSIFLFPDGKVVKVDEKSNRLYFDDLKAIPETRCEKYYSPEYSVYHNNFSLSSDCVVFYDTDRIEQEYINSSGNVIMNLEEKIYRITLTFRGITQEFRAKTKEELEKQVLAWIGKVATSQSTPVTSAVGGYTKTLGEHPQTKQ